MIIMQDVLTYDGETRPEKPSIYHVWSDAGWIMDIDAYKFAKLNDIKRAYQNVIADGVLTSNGIKLGCTPSEIQRIKTDYDYMVMSGKTTLFVQDFYGISHQVPMADVPPMLVQLGNSIFAINNTNKVLQDCLISATTQEQIAAICWPA